MLTLYEHPFAAYCWKPLIALFDRDVPFERRIVAGKEDRAHLAELWPPASIPVLVDDDIGLTLPESTTIVEYLDGHGEAPPLVTSLQARLWDRVIDGHVMTPVQKVVGDALRPEAGRDPYGVAEALAALDRTYALLERRLTDRGWLAGPGFTVADCAAAPALHYARVVRRWDEDRLTNLTRYFRQLIARPSVARVIDDAGAYRHQFPLPWPDYAR